jgi:DNA processing protein
MSAWLTLSLLPYVGPVTLRRLYACYPDPVALLQMLLGSPITQLTALGLRAPALQALESYRSDPDSHPLTIQARAALKWAGQPGNHLLHWGDRYYPERLLEIADPPPLLYVRGDPEVLSQPQIAIVGSRSASHQGLQNAQRFSAELSRSGLIPTSGLALGIDGAAHQGALEGLGLTVAVLGAGVDRIYPVRHRQLAEQIVDAGGALVSELPLGTAPKAQNFPRRNRIISGLSLGVLVVEAAMNSGSLITARTALDQSREVFAMPGSIHNATSKGCHVLIRQGAKLVENVDHIFEELACQLEEGCRPPGKQQDLVLEACSERLPDEGLPEDQARLMALVGYETIAVDLLVERSRLATDRVITLLLELELIGLIKSVAGGVVRS